MPQENGQEPVAPVFHITANSIKMASDLYHESRKIMVDTFPKPEGNITGKPFETFVRFTAYCVMQGVLMGIMLLSSDEDHKNACVKYSHDFNDYRYNRHR